MKKRYTTLPFLRIMGYALLLVLIFACKKADNTPIPINGEEQDEVNEHGALLNIVALASSVEDLSNLVAAIGAADPVVLETLNSSVQKTIFAPSNLAFSDLLFQLEGYDTLDDFDEEHEKQLLTEILKYHMVEGKKLSDVLTNGVALTSLQSEELLIKVDADIFIEDSTTDLAKVINGDNEASNGVVHIIDKILLPDVVWQQLFPTPTIANLINEADDLAGLSEALAEAGLTDMLNESGPFTVFAPSDAAIDELFELLGAEYASFDDFNDFLELQLLDGLLNYHVVPDNISFNELSEGTLMTSLEGNSIEVIASGTGYVIGDATTKHAELLEVDKKASNGTVHVIDKILIPQDLIDLIRDADRTDSKTIRKLVE